MIVNHYTHYAKCGEKLDQAAVWLSACLSGSTGLHVNNEVLHKCVAHIESPHSTILVTMDRREGKTSMCVALAVYAALRGIPVYYVPASRNSLFLSRVERACREAGIDNRLWVARQEVTMDKASIRVIPPSTRGLEEGLHLFDDFEHNYQSWEAHIGSNRYKTIGFQSPKEG